MKAILGTSAGVLPLHEPDHLGDLGVGENGMHPYLRLDQEDVAYRRVYDRAFAGVPIVPFKPNRDWLIAQRRNIEMRLFGSGRRVLVKTVFSLANTEWLARRYAPKVVVLLRHPCSIVYSIHRKWPEARLRSLLDQPALMEDYLEPWRDLISIAETPHEVLASRVGAYYYVALTMASRHPDWLIISHEDLCRDPTTSFRNLHDWLGLQWSDVVQGRIDQSNRPKTDDAVSHVNRVARDEIGKWRKLMTTDEIDQVKRFYEPFDGRVYTDFE